MRLDSVDTSELPPHELRRGIGYVFQRIGLFPHMTVGANIAVTPGLLGWPPSVSRRGSTNCSLSWSSIPPCATADRASLSGGQQQRVGVARALAAEPRVMLLDEPFGALDPVTRERLQQSFLRIRTRLALTTVFVTHDMTEALTLADRIGVMHEGRLLQLGTPRDLLTRPADDYVDRLMSTPRRQAAVVDALIGGTAAEGPVVTELLAVLPSYLTAHLQLTLLALLLSVGVSVPLGVAATRVAWIEQPALALAGLIQTVPSLALLAAMVPVLAALGLQSIGFLPAIVGLTLYGVLPVLRNTVTGIAGVDPALTEAARGVGMTPRQQLLLVELPLAMPIIVAGIRTATVWVVGIATLSTPVGATSLGNYIFSGLQTRNYTAILVGCVLRRVWPCCWTDSSGRSRSVSSDAAAASSPRRLQPSACSTPTRGSRSRRPCSATGSGRSSSARRASPNSTS